MNQQWIDRLFELGKKEGFEAQEIYMQSSKSLSISIYEGEIDKYSLSENGGLSYRGIFNGKMGYAYTEKMDDYAIEMLVHEAIENAKVIEQNDEVFLYSGEGTYHFVQLPDDKTESTSIEEKIDVLLAVEKKLKNYDTRIKRLTYDSLNEIESKRMIQNTLGLKLEESQCYSMIYAGVVAEADNDVRTGMGFDISTHFEDLSPEKIISEAANKALKMLGAKTIASKEYPVVFKKETFGELVGAFSGIFSAEAIQKNLSKLKGKLGTQIASELFTLRDEPFIESALEKTAFDAEGVPTISKAIIENGVLKTYLYNLKTANKDGVKSTGNASKGSYKGSVGISPTNLYIESGKTSFEALIQSTEEGMYITNLQGLHSGLDPISGDFSIQCQGFVIEKGQIGRPVSQITVAGNYFEMLMNIEAIGNDTSFSAENGGEIASPTAKIKALSISGE